MEFSAVDFIKTLGVSFAALFPIVNPVGDAPIFFGLTQSYPQSAQKVLARKIAAYGFVLLLVSALFGSEILAFFGISLFVIQIAGGLVVAATGWKLLNQSEDGSSSKQVPETLEDALQHAGFRHCVDQFWHHLLAGIASYLLDRSLLGRSESSHERMSNVWSIHFYNRHFPGSNLLH